MNCVIIDGPAIRKKVLSDLQPEITLIQPVLHIHVVGVNPVIETYVKAKHTAGERVGIHVEIIRHDATISEDALIDALLHSAARCDGMILQLPLPEHIDRQKVLNTIPTEKDADLLSDKTWLRFENEITKLIPPVAGAVLLALDAYNIDVYRKKVAIVGYGKLVGQPVAIVLKRRGAYIEVIDSKTSDMAKEKILRDADIVVTGVGRQGLIRPESVKDGVVLLDGGTSESEGGTAGDIALECETRASYFARVPGGLGPLTVASLLKNVVELARVRAGTSTEAS
jgi:methylenetetrahydrofolate dehydrogenase (NADP+)/methenyltetrahydrofolate cyclohydrolase